MEERDLSTTSLESHFLDGQDEFCWKRFKMIQFYFESPVACDSSVACEIATDADEVLFCPWVSNAEVMDAWRISWSVVLLRLAVILSAISDTFWIFMGSPKNWQASERTAPTSNFS